MAETRTGPEGEASEPGQHNFASFDDNDTSEQHRRDLTAPVCALAREHLGLDDEQLIQLVLAAPVSSQDDARYDPLWPMIVGPSSGGKSATIELTRSIPRVVMDDMTAASLLHGEKTRQNQWQVVGVLPRIGDRGLIVVPDFSTVLSMSDRGAREQLFSYLRRVYDGSLDRSISTCPIPLHWKGRVTVLAACTSAIDNYSSYQGELGTRFVYVRLVPTTGVDDKVAKLRAARRKSRDLEHVQDAARHAVEHATRTLPTVVVPNELEDLLDIAAAVCTFGRTSVPRDGYRRQVIGQAETEEPYRVKNQLDALARCALALGLDGPDAGALCCRVARDSMPKVRRDVLRALVEADGTPTTQDVAHAVTASWAVAHIALEDLELARVVTSEADQRFATEGGRTPMRWSLRPEFECHISRVFGTSRDV